MRGWARDDRVAFFGLFVGYLADLKVSIGTHMCGLRNAFVAAWVSTEGMDDPGVMMARSTGTLEVKPRRDRQRRSEETAKESASLELVVKVWEEEGVWPVEFSAAEMDRVETALAIRFAFHLFFRAGEFSHTRKSKMLQDFEDRWCETTLRAEDVVFDVLHAGDTAITQYTGGMMPTPVEVSEVVRMHIVVRISKTTHSSLDTRFDVIDPGLVTAEYGGEEGARSVRGLLMDLYRFSDISGARFRDPFFSNHRTILKGKRQQIRGVSHKVLTSHMVTAMLQAHAPSVGMDPKRISAKSLKKGAVRTMQGRTNATGLELAIMAHHANPASTGHYLDLSSHPAGPLALGHLPELRPLGNLGVERATHATLHAPGMNADGSPPKRVRRAGGQ